VMGQQVLLRASIGISVFPHDALEASRLLRHADTAMYTAKEAGGNGFLFYVTPPDASHLSST
jgi:GGDEF domain-containing protein